MLERNLNEEMLEEIRLEVLDSLNSSDEYEYEKEEIKENSNILIIESRDPIDTETSCIKKNRKNNHKYKS